MPPKAKKSTGTKKVKRTIPEANVYIMASYNNTLMTLTEPNGNVVAQSSAGACGFKGSRKSTPFAARLAAEDAMKKAEEMGIKEIDLFIKGPGPGREAAIRAIQAKGMKVRSISDVTPVPHNGCRPPKRRRV